MSDPAATHAVEANLSASSTKGDPALPHGGEDAIASTAAEGGHGDVPHAEPEAFGMDATFLVSLAMVAVIALMVWKKVPAAIAKALDRKIAGIREQLDEAAQLRAEAEALRAEYEGKVAAAGGEADAMLARARAEAEGIVAQANADSAALVERRGRMAEDKIAAAERAAIAEVRARAANAAVAAATVLIADRHDAGADKAMIDRTIAEL